MELQYEFVLKLQSENGHRWRVMGVAKHLQNVLNVENILQGENGHRLWVMGVASKIEILSISDAWPSRKESFLKKASVVVAAFYSRNSDVRISYNPPNSDVRILACSMRVRGGGASSKCLCA